MRRPHVLFIHPLLWRSRNVHQHLLRDWLAGESATSVVYPPLELAYGAAVARSLGYDVSILDASALHLRPYRVIEHAVGRAPNYIVIPSTRFSAPGDRELLAMLRRSLPACKLVLSGFNVSRDPAAFLASGLVDYVIHGELEVGLISVLRDGGGSNAAWFDAAGTPVVGGRFLADDLDALPHPARDLLPNRIYRTHYTRHNPFTLAITARGCTFRCNFCEIPVHGLGRIRFRSATDVVDELASLPALGIREVMFRDGTFTINRAHVLAICEGLLNRRLGLAWKCMTTVNCVDRELLAVMRRAGCHLVSFGFETGAQSLLDRVGKGTTLRQGLDAVAMSKEAGLETIGFFIIGLGGETAATIEQTITWARNLDLDYAQFMVLQPLHPRRPSMPGSDPFGWEEDEAGTVAHTHDLQPLDPATRKRQLVRSAARAYRAFYLRPRYWWKTARKIRSLEDLRWKVNGAFSLLTAGLAQASLSRHAHRTT